MRSALIAVVSGLLALATMQPAAADDYVEPPPFSVTIEGVQLDGPVGNPARMWYGLRSLDGQRERTYSSKLPKDGGYVTFGGTVHYPDGYCVTWVTVQWDFAGFYKNPLCTSSGSAAAPESTPEASATAEPAPVPSAAAPTEDESEAEDPAETDAAEVASDDGTAEATQTTATVDPEETPSEEASDEPSDPAEDTDSPATGAADDLPAGTTLVSSGMDLGDIYAERSAQASESATDSTPEPSAPMGVILAASLGLLGVSAGAGIFLSRLLKDPRSGL
ncbi:hypothetical protein [Paraoerskovia marina]|uniref:hypothetical protein n=1 Tax=Paraoerskovia marina TaxID=545619 RepID=UPI000492AFBB|nr:hypothetical protein [Paraoerskovia marina]